MIGDGSDGIGITQRELLIEMRDDIRALRAVVDSVARDQALSVERRACIGRVADTITARLDSHEKAILDLQRWRDEAAVIGSEPAGRKCVRPVGARGIAPTLSNCRSASTRASKAGSFTRRGQPEPAALDARCAPQSREGAEPARERSPRAAADSPASFMASVATPGR